MYLLKTFSTMLKFAGSWQNWNRGGFDRFSACFMNWNLVVESSYRNGPETCTFYPSPMLCKYVDRCICLKPSLQCSNFLAVDKIEIGVTSTLLRRTEREILGLFWQNLGPFFWFSVQYTHLVKRILVKIKPIIFRALDCLGWKTPLITGIFTFF